MVKHASLEGDLVPLRYDLAVLSFSGISLASSGAAKTPLAAIAALSRSKISEGILPVILPKTFSHGY